MSYRERGGKILSEFISLEKNRSIVEKNIFNLSNENEYQYFDLIYEFCYYLQTKNLKDVNEIFKKGNVGWNNEVFESEKQKQGEKDEYLTNPLQVEEGVMKCDVCNSNKTYSYQKQVRSADEGFSTFCFCLNCNHKWRIN
jgi:DNA-directed RNA polymerase subunit M/transcription elongation factor TFIIS